MGWKDELRPASFRGVSFQVEMSMFSGGRRIVSHEFPQRDLPYDEDMGRASRTFRVDAYVLGDDYIIQRDLLLTACETAGQGVLIHPYFGRRIVSCRGISIRESVTDGRMALLSLDFVETEEVTVTAPVQTIELADQVESAATSGKSSMISTFVANFEITGLPAFFRNYASGQVVGIADKINESKQLMKTATADTAQIKAAWDKTVVDLETNAASLVSNAENLAAAVIGIFDTAQTVTEEPSEVFGFYEALLDFGDDFPVIVENTSTRETQAKNQEKMIELVKVATLANAAEVATDKEYESYQEAITDRDLLIDEIEDILEVTDSDDLFRDLSHLRASVIQAVPDEAENLPRIIEYTPRQTLPEMVISYDLYDDAEIDIADRNNISHPGFIPGGQVLEVLSSV